MEMTTEERCVLDRIAARNAEHSELGDRWVLYRSLEHEHYLLVVYHQGVGWNVQEIGSLQMIATYLDGLRADRRSD